MPAHQQVLHENGTLITTTAHIVSTSTVRSANLWEGNLRQPAQEELAIVFGMEIASYPADEAASEEALRFRLANAPGFFRGFYSVQDGELMGFVCGTLAMVRRPRILCWPLRQL
jgi:hypothetical protein